MAHLREYNLVMVIKDVVAEKKPFLGICLGLQLLYESSEETPGVEGLGILKGKILKIPEQEGLKIPHMGWNSLHLQNDGRLFRGIEQNPYVYFVHSYYLKAGEEETVKATTEYSVNIHASVEKDNVFACQCLSLIHIYGRAGGCQIQWGCSSVGRAPALQAGGQGFESLHLH